MIIVWTIVEIIVRHRGWGAQWWHCGGDGSGSEGGGSEGGGGEGGGGSGGGGGGGGCVEVGVRAVIFLFTDNF